MACLVYNTNGELEDVVNFSSLEEEEAYEKANPTLTLEFIDDEDDFNNIDEEDDLDDNTGDEESGW